MRVGVHQGSILSPLLFITVMQYVRKSASSGVASADDITLAGNCSRSYGNVYEVEKRIGKKREMKRK